MDLERMHEYVTLCETLNFTKAARELYVSQSTLSKHMTQMEEELGSILIERSTHEVRLTQEGQFVRERFAQIVSSYEGCLQGLADMREGLTGRLRIGFIYYGGMSYLREGLDAFTQAYPNVKLEFVSQQPHDTIRDLKDGRLDAGLIYPASSLSESEFEFVPVHDCNLYAFVREGHPLAGLSNVTPADLDGRSFLMLLADPEYNEGIRASLARAGVSRGADAWCGQVDEFPRVLARSDAVFVSTGHMPHTPGDGLAMIPIQVPQMTLRVGLYAPRSSANGALEAFLGTWR